MKRFITFATLVLFVFHVHAQNNVDIRFNPSKVGETNTCFDIELRSQENTDILLAGQNYRIFYNPSKVTFTKDELISLNHKHIYSKARSLRSHYSEEISTAMMNLGIDALEYEKNKITTLKPHQWQKTSNVCITHDKNASYQLTWARERETGDLATAFVSLSEWVSEDKQKALEINTYYDYDYRPINASELFSSSISFYPNPVNNEMHLKVSDFGLMNEGTVVIVDTNGNQIHRQNIDNKQNLYDIDLEKVPSGNYFIEINNEAGDNVFQTTFVKTSL